MVNLSDKDVLYTLVKIVEEEQETDAKIAETILLNLDRISTLKNKDLSKLCFCDSATITRFIKRLGFNHYNDFKNWFIESNHNDVVQTSENITYQEIIEDNLKAIEKTQGLIQESQIDEVVEDLFHYQDIALMGGRYAQIVCQDMQMRFLSEHKLLNTFKDNVMLEYYIEHHPNGLLFVFSASMSHPLVERTIQIAKNNNYKIIAISHVLKDDLDLTLEIPFNERKWTYNSVEDRYCMLSVVDMIYLNYRKKLQKMQFSSNL